MSNFEFKDGILRIPSEAKENRHYQKAGMNWVEGAWCTPFYKVAKKVTDDNSVLSVMKAIEERNISESYAVEGTSTVYSPPGEDPYIYQETGAKNTANRPNILLADPMGVGKTIQAILTDNIMRIENMYETKHPKILIICPASLKINWRREWIKWSIHTTEPQILTSKSLIKCDIVILNYDILTKQKDALTQYVWDLLILDECHYVKNLKAQRTKALLGTWNKPGIKAHKKIAMSGTPILNKPIEIFPILKYLCPEGFNNYAHFGRRYCYNFSGFSKFDFSGAQNLDELQRKLRSTVMIRRSKEQVLPSLPSKIRQVIEIENPLSAEEKETLKFLSKSSPLNDSEFNDVVKQLQSNAKGVAYAHISTIRKNNGVAKLLKIINFLHNALLSSKKIVVFCHHKEVVSGLFEEFNDCSVVLTGSTPLKDRQRAVDEFQNNPDIKLFIGNIKAAGVGITLTKASHVLFAELSWVPGELNQAEDRCHRIGQKNSVLVQYLITHKSIDSLMIKAILRKQKLIDKSLEPNISKDFLKVLA